MADSYADEIIKRAESLKGMRGVWESHWEEIARRVLPRMMGFQGKLTPGAKRTEYQFDSTAGLALERFASAMESMLTPRTQRWHGLETGIPELDQDIECERALEAVVDILFRMRYAPTANFASQANENYLSLGAFGTGALFTDELPGKGFRYRAINLTELFPSENHVGQIDTVIRRFPMSARQAVQKWGAKCPESIRTAADNPSKADQEFEFIHCVKPNEERKYGRADYRGMAYSSHYVSLEGRVLLSEGGYRAMPYSVSRYVTAMHEVYGRSPAMTVLPDIKVLNEQEKTILRAAHMRVEPPLLATEDGGLQPFSLAPGKMNYGALNGDGTANVAALDLKGDIGLGLEMQDQKRRVINDAFLVTLFQILVETPEMTATEAMLRAQEKGSLLAPTMGRQQSEFLGPIIERELDILIASGKLPPMPPKLVEYFMAGGEVVPRYTSPLTRIQKSEDAIGILRTIEAMAGLAQFDPNAMRRINADEALLVVAAANGMPARALRTNDELAAMDEAAAAQQQAAAMVEAAPAIAGAAKNMAEAEAIAASAPRRGVPGASLA